MREVVVIGGGGHVGLPFSLILASKGFNVNSLDINDSIVRQINNGVFPFVEKNGDKLLKEVLAKGNFKATTDASCLEMAEIVIFVIGTPVDEHLSPNPNSVVNEVEKVLPLLKKTKLIILRSTLYPGVTKKISTLVKGNQQEIEVAYCPERILEGYALEEILSLPQIIGTESERAYLLARKLFEIIGVETYQTTSAEAELSKLFTNVWRYIKFAAANQFWMMSTELGVDYGKVRSAITYKYPRASDLPRSGFSAGPCLFKDTMQLSALVQQNFPLGHSAMMVNEGMPSFLVEKLKDKFDLAGLKVGILGMAFKADVDDIRSSLAYKLKKLLTFECLEVYCSDPYVNDETFLDFPTIIKKVDILIIGAPHSMYKNATFEKPVIDVWGFIEEAMPL